MKLVFKKLFYFLIFLIGAIVLTCIVIYIYHESYLDVLNAISSLVGVIVIPILVYYFGNIIVRRDAEQKKQIVLINYLIVELEVFNELLLARIKEISQQLNKYKKIKTEIKSTNNSNKNIICDNGTSLAKIYLEMDKKDLSVLSAYSFDAYKNVITLFNKIKETNDKIEDYNNSTLMKYILEVMNPKKIKVDQELFDYAEIAIKIGLLRTIRTKVIKIQDLLIRGIFTPIYNISYKLDDPQMKQIHRDEIGNLVIKSTKNLEVVKDNP